MTEEVVVLYLVCERYGEQGYYVEDNRGQGVILRKRLEQLNWCGCQERRKEKAARPREAKAQQSSIQSGELKSTTRERDSQKEVRRTFGILREVWLNVGVEKMDTHKGIMIKTLLDSGTTGMFIDRKTAAKHGFRL